MPIGRLVQLRLQPDEYEVVKAAAEEGRRTIPTEIRRRLKGSIPVTTGTLIEAIEHALEAAKREGASITISATTRAGLTINASHPAGGN